MAKKSSVRKNNKRISLALLYMNRRKELKDIIYNKTLSMAERFVAQQKLSSFPRNSSSTRIRNRCLITGRSRGYYRKFKLSRLCLRELASCGLLPGVTKASW